MSQPSGSPAAGAQSDTEYYPAFDWLRGLLAFVVMLYHDRVIDWPHSASIAVEVFFALSGWLIGGLLLHMTRADLPRFFFNRAVRIWVPYFIAFALLLAASLMRDRITDKWLEFVIYKLAFVYNLFGPPQLATQGVNMPLGGTGNHFWSVNAEEQFYLIAPLLLVVASRWGRHLAVWALIAVLAWWGQYYASIVFGVTAAVAAHHLGRWYQTVAGRSVLGLVLVGSAVAIVMDVDYARSVPFFAVSVVLLLAFQGAKRPLGALVGGMSYPLYLNHWIGVFVANAALKPFGLRDSSARHLLAIVVSVAIAVALYWWVDRRLLARRNAWFTPERGKVLASVGYGVTTLGLAFGLWLSFR